MLSTSFTQANKQKKLAIASGQFNWLILDAASCPEAYWFTKGSGAPIISLFEEQDQALQDYGAWLINIIDYPDIIRLTLAKDINGSAALWCKSALDVEILAQQLRFRLYASLPDGRTVRFRWYDTRVLDSWLASQTVDRRIKFLQPFYEIAYTPPNPFYANQYLTCWYQLTDGSYSCKVINLKDHTL